MLTMRKRVEPCTPAVAIRKWRGQNSEYLRGNWQMDPLVIEASFPPAARPIDLAVNGSRTEVNDAGRETLDCGGGTRVKPGDAVGPESWSSRYTAPIS